MRKRKTQLPTSLCLCRRLGYCGVDEGQAQRKKGNWVESHLCSLICSNQDLLRLQLFVLFVTNPGIPINDLFGDLIPLEGVERPRYTSGTAALAFGSFPMQ